MEFSASEGAVQPEGTADNGNGDEGQGAQSQELDPGLYPGIESVPQEHRQYIDPILKEINTNANNRIAEVNSKLDEWKPYEELGLRDNIDPETMKGLIGFVEMLGEAQENPDNFKQWWESTGKEFGFFGGEEGEFDDSELFDGEDGEDTPDIRQIVKEAIQEEMQPVREREEAQQKEQIIGQINQRIDQEFNDIKNKYGAFSDDEEKNAQIEARIVRLAMQYVDEQNNGEGSIAKGFEEYQSILKDGEGTLFQEVANQPSTPQGPGTPDTTKEKPTDMKSAEAIAKERLAHSQS